MAKPKELRQPYSGIYSAGDAALFLRATTPPPKIPINIWEKRRGRFVATSRHVHRWVEAREGSRSRHIALDFVQLIRSRMIVLLRAHGHSLGPILYAEANMREITGMPQPFVTEPMWSSSHELFFEFEDQIRSASRPAQLLFSEIVREFMTPIHHGLQFDQSGLTTLWMPMPGIIIDPELQFGAPCVEGTRVETEALWSFKQTGEDADSLADLFGLTTQQVNAALDWERVLAKAA